MITEFKYADSEHEVQDLVQKGFTIIAGGTQINNGARISADSHWTTGKMKLVSIYRLGMTAVKMTGPELEIGAMTSLQELADHPDAPPALRTAAGFIPTRNVRNQATVGGNIAAARSDSYIIPTLMALNARVKGFDSGNKPAEFSVEEYLSGSRDLFITLIVIPDPALPCVAVKESRSHLALPVVSAAVSLGKSGVQSSGSGADNGPVVAAGCVAERTIRLTALENRLAGGIPGRAELEKLIAQELSPRTDTLGSAEYKRYINGQRIADAVVQLSADIGRQKEGR